MRLDQLLPHLPVNKKFKVAIGVLVSMAAHAIEIWVFAFAYYFEDIYIENTELLGNFTGTLMDCAYFSFTTYTTLGFGDIHPDGPIRYLVGLESLTGLVLVTWTASYLYLVMVESWDHKSLAENPPKDKQLSLEPDSSIRDFPE